MSPLGRSLTVDHAATTAARIAEVVQAERLARHLHRCKSQSNAPAGAPLAALFAVVGAVDGPPHALLTRAADAALAADKAVVTALEFFAFPTASSASAAPPILVDDLAHAVALLRAPPARRPHVFVLTTTDANGDRAIMYGCCLASLAVNHAAPLAGPLADPPPSRLSLSERCFVVVSAAPLFPLHFAALAFLCEQERSRLAALLSGAPTDVHEATLADFLLRYCAALLPEPGERLALSEQLQCVRVTGDEEADAFSKFGVPDTLLALGARSLCTTLSALLQETKVVVACSDVTKLSQLVLALSCLLRPFFWQGVLITTLPEQFKPLLGAPTFVLCGVLELDASTRAELSDGALIVDATTAAAGAKLSWTDGKPVDGTDLALLPQHVKLELRLDELRRQAERERAAGHSTDALATVISDTVRMHLEALFVSFPQCCVRDVTTRANRAVSAFVPSIFCASPERAADIDFYDALFGTQLWSTYCDARLRAQDEAKAKELAMVTASIPSVARSFSSGRPAIVVTSETSETEANEQQAAASETEANEQRRSEQQPQQ